MPHELRMGADELVAYIREDLDFQDGVFPPTRFKVEKLLKPSSSLAVSDGLLLLKKSLAHIGAQNQARFWILLPLLCSFIEDALEEFFQFIAGEIAGVEKPIK